VSNEHTVKHFGIHWTKAGVAFLQQGRGGTNAIGLKERSPYVVKLPRKSIPCNHLIALAAPVPDVTHWNFFIKLFECPLFRAFLPVPKDDAGAFYVDDPDDKLSMYLVLLSKLSSPIYPPITPISTVNTGQILDELQVTNIQPFVLTRAAPEHAQLLEQIGKALPHQPRALIVTGSSDVTLPPPYRRIVPTVTKWDTTELALLPLEHLGAVVARRHMRGEQMDAPQEDRRR
jgi:hypothetical protein